MGLIRKNLSLATFGGVSYHSRREMQAKQAKAQAKVAKQEAKLLGEQRRALHDERRRDAREDQAEAAEAGRRPAVVSAANARRGYRLSPEGQVSP